MLKVRNQLPAVHPQFGHPFDTSTHLHGSASLPQYDGYASDVTPSGYVKDYHYPNFQPARTLWYHDHGVHFTAQNAYGGLAAQYHLHDPVERALLPQGEFDVPITITRKSDNNLTGTIGNGGCKLDLARSNGNITITRE